MSDTFLYGDPEEDTPDEITISVNETIDVIGNTDDAFVRQVAYNLLEQSEW